MEILDIVKELRKMGATDISVSVENTSISAVFSTVASDLGISFAGEEEEPTLILPKFDKGTEQKLKDFLGDKYESHIAALQREED